MFMMHGESGINWLKRGPKQECGNSVRSQRLQRNFSLQTIFTSRERAKEYNSVYENVIAQYYRQKNIQYMHENMGYKTLKNNSTGRKYETTKHDRETRL
jgi:hypothetical protein